MGIASLILLFLGLLFFAVATLVSHPRYNLIALGLFCVTLAFVLQQASITIAPK